MEKVIDRREYRRNDSSEKNITEEQVEFAQRKIKKFLLQTLGVSLILLGISFLKFYKCVDVLNAIEKALNSKITVSSIQKSGQIIYSEVTNYYNKLNEIIRSFSYEKNEGEKLIHTELIKNNNKESFENILYSSGDEILQSMLTVTKSGDTLNSGNNYKDENNLNNTEVRDYQFESAVEGINQMSEDAKYIKNNYKMSVPVIGTITSVFGVRNSENPKVSSYHSGLDIAANTGTQVLAALDGEVIEAATDTYLGKYIKIKKDDVIMVYAHCSKLLVKKGDKVNKGKLIAYVGNTGNSTGPHLHFELKYQDRLVDPLDVLEIKE
ncbi:MAG: M23 family metallopeptidase [Clostridia bacterium]|nr:M23 family metallopeptidase [Clostridia bacterium]